MLAACSSTTACQAQLPTCQDDGDTDVLQAEPPMWSGVGGRQHAAVVAGRAWAASSRENGQGRQTYKSLVQTKEHSMQHKKRPGAGVQPDWTALLMALQGPCRAHTWQQPRPRWVPAAPHNPLAAQEEAPRRMLRTSSLGLHALRQRPCRRLQSTPVQQKLGKRACKEGLVARNQAELPANLTGMGCSRPVTTRCTACNAAYG